MTPDIALTLGIIIAAVILFATEKVRVDMVALLVLLAVSITGLVSKEEVFLGFANSAVITIWAVYIVSGGLFKTGVADRLGSLILRLSGASEVRLITVIMLTCGIMSAFMNNVGAVAVLMPAVIGISKKTNIPVSKLLIPLAFSSLLGGKMTLIGTPANILAQGILLARNLPAFGFFEITPMGILVLGTGIIYMVIIGRHLLPVRETAADPLASSQLREYISDVQITAESPLREKNLYESKLGADYDLTVLSIIRDGKPLIGLHRDFVIQENDHLILEGSAQNLISAQEELEFKIQTDPEFEFSDLDTEQSYIFEATLAPRSTMVGRTLNNLNFRDSFGLTALAIWRQGDVITEHLRDVELRFGDSLLLQGPPGRVRAIQKGNEFLVLEPVEVERNRRNKAPLAAGIMLLVILLAIFTNLGIAVSMLIGSVSMVLTGCLTMDEAYESIDWRTVFLVGGMLSLGIAMENTGTAQFLADILLGVLGDFGPLGLLAGIYILSALITQPMSNAAAIVLIVPIAVDTALGLGVNHLTFTMAVVIGAATSFLSPVGHKANVLVFGPGGYKFSDYTRVGAILTIALFVVSMIFLPILWPFFD
ncbi:MAG: SLC13 family permease [Chloroflexota bacterium]|nr:MAG: SLC13 family permease [Chloroflexota bacterium]